jgi:RNA polymerase sigma factor (sigma-70 family)
MRSPRDNSAWEKFLGGQKRLLTGIVYPVARRFGVMSLDEIDDAVQEVCLKMSSLVALGKIPDNDDGVLETYMKAVVANAAHDYFRSQRAKKRDVLAPLAFDSDLADRTPAPSDIESEVLLSQLQCLAGNDQRSRQVFQLYYRSGWTAKEIASIPGLGLSAKGVESLVYRMTSELRNKMKAVGFGAQGGSEKEFPPYST